jgi:ribosomal protein S27E
VNDSQEENIAAQAPEALHQKTRARDAAQAPGVTAREPAPELIGALPEQEPDTPVIVTTEAVPERFLAMNCPRCTAILSVYDRSTELRCRDCGAEVIVERKECTVALRLQELVEEPDPIAVSAASAKRDEELQKLRAEAATAINVKRSAGILGGLVAVGFAYLGFTEMAARNIAMSAGILICGSALLISVVCITRHTTKIRADLTMRIRAITASKEYSADHP